MSRVDQLLDLPLGCTMPSYPENVIAAPFPVCVVLVLAMASSSCVSGKALRGQAREIVHNV